ncbi:hypothetical protein [Dongia rigui]|uniref:Organic solvent tolerance-like N-terminal domain-containing protein n=1 Tax=Dongia rigui TaxID=940149 RepID=A0ABU5E0Y7_9PROT|nr:hypothetical protein [Dongia rigui]MDY0873220.1 hypothetical protein [Dongia rigui]
MAGSLAVASLILLAPSAMAASKPVAIVEDSPLTMGRGQAFDLLNESEVLTLAPQQTLVLGYLKSCTRETITGGTVTIGAKESTVEGGKVTREKTVCTQTKLALTADESQQSATIAFRGQIKHVYTRQPLIVAEKSETVKIEPIEGGESWNLKPENGRIDFQAAKVEMQPGARYKVTGAKTSLIVEVDAAATTAKTGTLERVVVLELADPTN